jgi:Fe-S-cluster-containing dehydrogenase component
MTGQSTSTSRRGFLAASAGASIASLLGCLERQPPEEIVPYVRAPEHIVPGRPLWFASAMIVGGYGYGTLVESHEGRPTKIEGHPEHPSSLGATDAQGQALIRDFVDDGRTRTVLYRGVPHTWAGALAAIRTQLEQLGPRQLAILTGRVTSPTTARMIEALAARYPSTRWYAWESISEHNALAGAREALARPLHEVPRLDRARVLVSLDDDIFADRPGRLAHARAFAHARAPQLPPDQAMRLYVLESFPSITGAVADHRLLLRDDELIHAADALLAAIRGPSPRNASSLIELAAHDLRAAGSSALVLAGLRQPPRVHAIAHAINHLLGSANHAIEYYDRFDRGPVAGVESLLELAESLRAGEVAAVLLLDDVNPLYDAPPELELERLLAAVPLIVHHGVRWSESAAVADWHVPAAHLLESWADVRAHEGTPTLLQPLIRPLFDGRTGNELLAGLLGWGVSGRALVRETWLAAAPTEADWLRAVHDGRLPNELMPVQTSLAAGVLDRLGTALEVSERSDLLLAFRPDPTLHDGRFAHNPWLQELPKPITTIAWDNAAFLAPETAAAHGLEDDQLVRLSVDGQFIEIPVRTLAGLPRGQVTVHLGHGRQFAGEPSTGVDVYPLRTLANLWTRAGLELTPLADHRAVIIVQKHHQLEGRALVREALRHAYVHDPKFAFDRSPLRPPSLHPEQPLSSPNWAMTIDLNLCIGCGACVIACQAENNIPTVGPDQVSRGREMHWIRIDHYELAHGRSIFQPVPCMHCEHAPCEVVCPTAATVHSDDGLNDMVYNRCIGTRYCNNNCPYKVRRFNFYRYASRDALIALSRNPDVTVRARGVMEKCTYCVQRIRAGGRTARRERRPLRDGEIQTACQQACPTRTIQFGDLGDPNALVRQQRSSPRNYALLGELGTRPRTTYLGRLHNPNPATEQEES